MGDFFTGLANESSRQRTLALQEEAADLDKKSQSGIAKVRQLQLQKLGLDTLGLLQKQEDRSAEQEFFTQEKEGLQGSAFKVLQERGTPGFQELGPPPPAPLTVENPRFTEASAQLPTGLFPDFDEESQTSSPLKSDMVLEQIRKMTTPNIQALLERAEQTQPQAIPALLERFGIQLQEGKGQPRFSSTFRELTLAETGLEPEELQEQNPETFKDLRNQLRVEEPLRIAEAQATVRERVRQQTRLGGAINVFQKVTDLTLPDPATGESLFLPASEVAGVTGTLKNVARGLKNFEGAVTGTNFRAAALANVRTSFKATLARLAGDVGNLAQAEQRNAVNMLPNPIGSLSPFRLPDTQEVALDKLRLMGEFLMATLKMVDSGQVNVIDETIGEVEQARQTVDALREAGILSLRDEDRINSLKTPEALRGHMSSLINQASQLEEQKNRQAAKAQNSPLIKSIRPLFQQFRSASNDTERVKIRQKISAELQKQNFPPDQILKFLQRLEAQ